MKYYAVRIGRNPGIYNTWDECKTQVIGYKNAVYKKFNSYDEAMDFMDELDNMEIKTHDKLANDEIIAYVDGSYSEENNIYSYGMVIINGEGIEKFKGRGDNKDMASMRNVSGELLGAIEAMRLAIKRNKKRLYLHYDYAGIEKWARGDWKTNKVGTRWYKEFYDKIKEDIDVVFVKVEAHSGVKYNEEADLLAKEAIKEI